MRLLFATDGSPGSTLALDYLASLPLSARDPVTVLTVAGRGDREASREIAAAAAARLRARGATATVRVESGPVADVIRTVALDEGCELVVLGSRGRGEVAGAILGSTARAIAHASVVPLLAVRRRHDAPHHILAAVDGSVESERALALLVRLPLPRSAGSTYLQLAPHTPHAADQILANADRASSDLIVLGLHEQAEGHGLFDSSLADQVLSRAHCPVLIAAGRAAVEAARGSATGPYPH